MRIPMLFVRWLACCIVSIASCSALAQAWPTGSVKLVVPYGPGSTPDIVARLVAERLAPRIGHPVVVENKAGAGGNIGIDAVAKSRPDGQTIGLGIAGPLAVNPLLFGAMPYDPARDLAPVTIAVSQPSVLVASPQLAVKDIHHVLQLLKANPGKYNYASLGGGSISHLAMEAVAARTGSDLVHVPYAASGAAVMAVLSGDVQLACLPIAAVLPHIRAGKLMALAVATRRRASALPELPTLAEAGLPDVYADAWMGFVVPAKTPAATVKRLHDEIVAVLGTADMRDRLKAQAMDVVASTPEEMRAVMEADVARWKPVIEKNRIRLD